MILKQTDLQKTYVYVFTKAIASKTILFSDIETTAITTIIQTIQVVIYIITEPIWYPSWISTTFRCKKKNCSKDKIRLSNHRIYFTPTFTFMCHSWILSCRSDNCIWESRTSTKYFCSKFNSKYVEIVLPVDIVVCDVVVVLYNWLLSPDAISEPPIKAPRTMIRQNKTNIPVKINRKYVW